MTTFIILKEVIRSLKSKARGACGGKRQNDRQVMHIHGEPKRTYTDF